MPLVVISRLFGARRRGQPLTLHQFLQRLIWLCMLPLVALAAGLGWQQIRTATADSELAVQQRVQSARDMLDLKLEGRIQVLETLAQSRALDTPRDLQVFHGRAVATRNGIGGDIILADPKGQMLVHTARAYGIPLPMMPQPRGRAALSGVLATGKPAVGDVVLGPVTGSPLVALGVPVQRDGTTVAVLLTVMDASSFDRLLPSEDMPVGWTLQVLDSQGQTILQRGKFAGAGTSEGTSQGTSASTGAGAAPGPAPGKAAAANLRSHVAPSRLTPWRVVLDVPAEYFHAPLRSGAWKLTLLVLAVTATGALGGTLAARRLTRSVGTLARRSTDPEGPDAVTEVALARRVMNETQDQRSRALAALDDSQRTFQALVNSMDDAVLFTDPSRRLRLVNPAFTLMYGYTAEEVVGRTTEFLYPGPTEFDRLGREHFNVHLEGRTPAMEMCFRRKDGSEVWVEVSAMRIPGSDGVPTGIMGVHRDISERRRVQSELLAHRARLEEMVSERTAALAAANDELAERTRTITALYDGAPCGYLSMHADGTITEANRTALTLLDQTPETFIGHRFAEFLTPDSRAAHVDRARAFLRGGQARGLAYDMLRRDGSVVAVLLDADFERDADGTMVGARATLVDDSLRRTRDQQIADMQLELARRAEQAEAANRAKSAFLANMSHEIRTPLNAIIGLTHLLANDTADARQRDRLGKVAASGQHLLQVINDVLDLSKIDAGKMVLHLADFDLDSVLADVLAMVADAARDKGVALLLLPAPDLPKTWHGDATRLSQALLNLLSNAVKFTASGEVRLQAQLMAWDGSSRAQLRFEVQDTGDGISPDRQRALFSAFEQADNSMTRRHGGTGLGLALTRHLAELMGGQVGVRSAVGQGSTFWFTAWLQAAAPAAHSPATAAGAAPPRAAADAPPGRSEALLREHHQGRRVLLAEDNPVNQEVASALLEVVGLAVDVVGDGAKAVAAVLARDYDLVLMDMQMPVMDGMAATRAIRACGVQGVERLPIIAMTANAFNDDRLNCLAAGMNDHVAKPVDANALYATLLRWLPPSA
jgi:PAS domain S-box-containing protein